MVTKFITADFNDCKIKYEMYILWKIIIYFIYLKSYDLPLIETFSFGVV